MEEKLTRSRLPATRYVAPSAGRQSVAQVLGSLLRRRLPAAAGPAPTPLASALPWLWAVAARTRYPAAVFEALVPELPSTPPRQTTKLLAAYVDPVART